MKKLILSFILIISIISAQPSAPSTYNFSTNSPSSVTNVNTQVINSQSNGLTYFYFIVAKYPIGNSAITSGIRTNNAPNPLSSNNYISITWNGVAGATGYDLIRLTTNNFPSSGICTNCLISSNTSNTSINDISNNTLGNYTLSTVSSITASITLNNKDYPFPMWVYDSPQQIGTIFTKNAAFGPPTGTLANRPISCYQGNLYYETSTPALTVCSITGNPGTWITVSSSSTVTPAAIQTNQYTLVTVSGSTPNYIGTMSPNITSYLDGMIVFINTSSLTCTGANLTININSLGAAPLYNTDSTYLTAVDCGYLGGGGTGGVSPFMYSAHNAAFAAIEGHAWYLYGIRVSELANATQASGIMTIGQDALTPYDCTIGGNTNFDHPSICMSNGTNWIPVGATIYTGTTGTVSGALTLGTCNITTVSITGVLNSMVVMITPVSNPDTGTAGLVKWDGYVSSTNIVTVRECGLGTITPNATAFNVRVLQ